ncbi:DUF3833 domain-containing protein [Microbaculum marinisediminis]|uniref:DUF3833 domain-containing protein n=1 Tax=Microbaculum marinisediminis TaxID=2931392 RepID=A0AAW5R034_9HYPH|nr:DUF3833 domain-containing protein [Microbaculum sp. A6E488]MCT8973323.1 DUF3833 domain-containing protein [Microbaculum sp. A6E488]
MLDAARYITPDTLDLTRYFLGRTFAWGVFQDRFGTVRRRFSVVIDGTWQGGTFVMTEAFRNDDGSGERRVWRIDPSHHGRFSATADDVIGRAEGRAHGPEVSLSYRIRLTVGGRGLVARFDDRMVLIDEDTVANRGRVSKFGITLGEVTILFRRDAGGGLPRCAA